MKRPPLILSSLLALACWSASQAQGMPPPPPGLFPGGPPADMQQRVEAREAERAKDLRTVLRITADQEPALAAYLSAVRPPRLEEKRPDEEAREGEPKPLSTPDRLARMAEMEAKRERERRRRDEATLAFYQKLKPDQREVFDALARLSPPPGGPMQIFHMAGGPPPLP